MHSKNQVYDPRKLGSWISCQIPTVWFYVVYRRLVLANNIPCVYYYPCAFATKSNKQIIPVAPLPDLCNVKLVTRIHNTLSSILRHTTPVYYQHSTSIPLHLSLRTPHPSSKELRHPSIPSPQHRPTLIYVIV